MSFPFILIFPLKTPSQETIMLLSIRAFIRSSVCLLSVRDECSWRFSNLGATKSKCSPNFCFLPIFFYKIAKFVFIVFRNFYKLTKAEQTMSKKRHRPTSRIIHPSLSDTYTPVPHIIKSGLSNESFELGEIKSVVALLW